MIKKTLFSVLMVGLMACSASKPVVPDATPEQEQKVVHEWDSKTPLEVCVDFATTLCYRASQCGQDVDACVTSLGEACASVTAVTNVDALYEQCLPQLETIACNATQLPEVCLGIFS